jgi:hypothetical protein
MATILFYLTDVEQGGETGALAAVCSFCLASP